MKKKIKLNKKMRLIPRFESNEKKVLNKISKINNQMNFHTRQKMNLRTGQKINLQASKKSKKINNKNNLYTLKKIKNQSHNNLNSIEGFTYHKKSKLDKISKISTIILYVFIIGLILSMLLIGHFSKKIRPALIKYAEAETKRIITLIINNSVDNADTSLINYDSILEIERDNNNEIKMINFNTNNVNKILETINNQVQYNIKQVEKGNLENVDDYLKDVSEIDYEKIKDGIVYYIPFGNITGNILVNNIGPKIPIKFTMSGDVVSSIKSSVKEYGINNAMIEVSVEITVSMIVNAPFVTREIKVDNSIPIIMKIIQGTIPEYYFNPTN